ncbi:MAG TPA: hypothetical protein VMG82_17110 [Candidatus Sulfotelmatobacter sp.]|nr:hypothetical protein [Candidatus Sulfotelmatobacter sp.]
MNDERGPIAPYTRIRYLGMGDITLYPVTDDDLHTIERGGGSSTLLALWIFFASVSASFFVSLLVSSAMSIKAFIVIVVVVVGCAVSAIITFALWKRASGDIKDTIRRIRERGVAHAPGEVIDGTEKP